MMKSARLCYIAATALSAASLHAVDLSNEEIESLRDWLNSKRMVTVKELGGQLSISGDIHAEMQSSTQFVNGSKPRHGKKDPSTSYDVEFNLNFDYRNDRTWSAARVRFDNSAGVTNKQIGSGTSDKIKVDRAYFGYRIYDGDRHTADVEAGRRPRYTVWDSRLQFGSNFDGVTFKDSYAFEKAGDFYYSLGAFMVNEKKGWAAYGSEIGLLNIARTGFYTKYSMIDWNTKRSFYVDNVRLRRQVQFAISQLILGYKFVPQQIDKLVHVFAAGLCNHIARHRSISAHKRANKGGYAGIAVGETKRAGDWVIDAGYQVLQAQCVPDFDVLGIGLGYNGEHSFYYNASQDDATKNRRSTAEGNVNFRGFWVTLQYLVTNNINIFQEYKQSITLDHRIGPFTRYKQYEIDFIYSF